MDLPKPNLSAIKLKAVVLGALTDNGVTLFFMMFLITSMRSTDIPQEEIAARMKSLSGLLLSLIIGLGGTVLGGFVAGRVARSSEVLHGALVAMVGMVLAVFLRDTDVPLWYDIVGFAGMLPAGMYGGYLVQRVRLPTDRKDTGQG